MKVVCAYADASLDQPTGIGAWSAVFTDGHFIIGHDGGSFDLQPNSSSVIAELAAIVRASQAVCLRWHPKAIEVFNDNTSAVELVRSHLTNSQLRELDSKTQ